MTRLCQSAEFQSSQKPIRELNQSTVIVGAKSATIYKTTP